MDFYCSFCNSCKNVEFDLQHTLTSSSKVTLFALLQSCIKEDFYLTSYLICKECYTLLNELDSMKLKTQQIENKLKEYLKKYHANDQTQVTLSTVIKLEQCLDSVNRTHRNLTPECEVLTNQHLNERTLEISSEIEDTSLLNETNIKEEAQRENIEAKKAVNKDNLKPYSCTQCPKTWRTITELKNHIASHSNEKPYICDICGHAYKQRKALKVHIGMHKGVNPFTCVHCNKSFTQKGSLMRHIPIHTGEFPFQCDLCGKRFVHHSSFKIHKLGHAGEKSIKCETCGLSLISKSHLRRHTKIHTGEKKFACATCGKKFAEKYNLVAHEKLHLGISKPKRHNCHLCNNDNFFKSRVKLEEHFVQAHQMIK